MSLEEMLTILFHTKIILKKKVTVLVFFPSSRKERGHCKPMTFVSLHAEDGQPQQEEILHTEIASATLTH